RDRRRRRGRAFDVRCRRYRRALLLRQGEPDVPLPRLPRSAAGILPLLDTQRGVHQGARRRSLLSARPLRRLARTGGAGTHPAPGARARRRASLAHGKFRSGGRLRCRPRRGGFLMSTCSYESPWLTDEVRMFRATVRQFIQKEFLPHQDRWREQRRPDAAAWTAAGDAGLLLADVPDAYGGGGGTFAHEAVVVDELARAGIAFGSGIQSVVAHYIRAYGSEHQKREWLPRMARGELVGAIAMSEPGAGSDLSGIQTTARRDNGYYVVNGSKTFVTNGGSASLVCVAAKTDSTVGGLKGISLVLVETPGLAGYRVGRPLDKVGMHAQDTCELFFDDVRIPAANLLGPAEGKGFSQMMDSLPYERLAVAVRAVAMAEQAERTPDLPAVAYEGQRLSYRELNRRADRLARHLRRHGVGPEVPVGLFVERSLDMVVGILGILKAGAPYVPIDAEYPPERI